MINDVSIVEPPKSRPASSPGRPTPLTYRPSYADILAILPDLQPLCWGVLRDCESWNNVDIPSNCCANSTRRKVIDANDVTFMRITCTKWANICRQRVLVAIDSDGTIGSGMKAKERVPSDRFSHDITRSHQTTHGSQSCAASRGVLYSANLHVWVDGSVFTFASGNRPVPHHWKSTSVKHQDQSSAAEPRRFPLIIQLEDEVDPTPKV